MAPTTPNARLRALTRLAASQGGYFTTQQAQRLGYRAPHLSYHASVGNIERAGHGIYRIAVLPLSEHDDLIRLWLWSRGRDDRPLATCSHQTALDLHALSEEIPNRIHLTVPVGFRKRAPRGCVLHIGAVSRSESHPFGPVPATTPRRTLADLARDASFPHDQFVNAIRKAHGMGIIDSAARKQLLALRDSIVKAAPSTHSTIKGRRSQHLRKDRP